VTDYTSLGSETRTIQNRIDALQGSTIAAIDILYLSEALQILGTSLGVNDVVGATNAGIAQVAAAGASTINVVNGTSNGSAVSSLSSQYNALNILYTNHNGRIASLESVSSNIAATANSASAAVSALASYNPWQIITANKLAVNGDRYFVVPASGLTITLPSAPSIGAEVVIVDAAGTSASTPFTVTAGAGGIIQGSITTFNFNVNGAGKRFIYSNSTYGWRVF